jgi:hypothetical protein
MKGVSQSGSNNLRPQAVSTNKVDFTRDAAKVAIGTILLVTLFADLIRGCSSSLPDVEKEEVAEMTSQSGNVSTDVPEVTMGASNNNFQQRTHLSTMLLEQLHKDEISASIKKKKEQSSRNDPSYAKRVQDIKSDLSSEQNDNHSPMKQDKSCTPKQDKSCEMEKAQEELIENSSEEPKKKQNSYVDDYDLFKSHISRLFSDIVEISSRKDPSLSIQRMQMELNQLKKKVSLLEQDNTRHRNQIRQTNENQKWSRALDIAQRKLRIRGSMPLQVVSTTYYDIDGNVLFTANQAGKSFIRHYGSLADHDRQYMQKASFNKKVLIAPYGQGGASVTPNDIS